MGRLTSKLVQTAYKVSSTTNRFGDRIYAPSVVGSPCMYRDIADLSARTNREEVTLDGILWFDADEVLSKGDVYELEGQYYQIDRIVIARARLTDNVIAFFKCGVTKQRQIS